MRKTSQDGGDSTSITSGFENDMKKPGVGILKNKRSSIKRKVQSLSHESDDTVIEPLLQKDKDKMEIANRSAKFMLSKTKTDSINEKDTERDKLLSDSSTRKPSITAVPSVTQKENLIIKTTSNVVYTTHSFTYPCAFSNGEIKSAIIAFSDHQSKPVETDGTQKYNSPLIFTTAKIHTDGKNKQMEPVQMTLKPILSTTIKSEHPITEVNSKHSECARPDISELKKILDQTDYEPIKLSDKTILLASNGSENGKSTGLSNIDNSSNVINAKTLPNLKESYVKTVVSNIPSTRNESFKLDSFPAILTITAPSATEKQVDFNTNIQPDMRLSSQSSVPIKNSLLDDKCGSNSSRNLEDKINAHKVDSRQLLRQKSGTTDTDTIQANEKSSDSVNNITLSNKGDSYKIPAPVTSRIQNIAATIDSKANEANDTTVALKTSASSTSTVKLLPAGKQTELSAMSTKTFGPNTAPTKKSASILTSKMMSMPSQTKSAVKSSPTTTETNTSKLQCKSSITNTPVITSKTLTVSTIKSDSIGTQSVLSTNKSLPANSVKVTAKPNVASEKTSNSQTPIKKQSTVSTMKPLAGKGITASANSNKTLASSNSISATSSASPTVKSMNKTSNTEGSEINKSSKLTKD